MKRLALLPLLVAGLLPSPAAAGAVTVSTVSHGVMLTVGVPARVYPRHALVRVRLQVQNVSHGAVHLIPESAVATVSDASGTVVYPGQEPSWVPAPNCCPPRAVPVFRSGGIVTLKRYVVLQGNQLRAGMPVGQHGFQIETPPLRLRLVAARLPHLRLVTRAPPVVAFQSSEPDHGPLMYAASFRCATSTGGTYTVAGLTAWTQAAGPHITLDSTGQCRQLRNLIVMAGYLNHPVAVLVRTAS